VGYLCANFGLPRPLYSRFRPDVRDRRQTSDRQTSDKSMAILKLSVMNCPSTVNIAGITKIRLPGSVSRGAETKLNSLRCLSVIYSEKDQLSLHLNGVALFLDKTKRSLVRWQVVSSRILTARLLHNMAILLLL